MRFYLSVLSLICTVIGNAQSSISGRVQDQETGSSIEYATVSIFAVEDSSLIDGTITNEDGYFTIDNLPEKNVYILAQFLGYRTYSSESLVIENEIDLGNIGLTLNNTALDEVLVTGKTLTSIHKLDKQVYDAGQFQNARGGSATDVIKNLPSVTINSFGDISVRGTTGFMVMVNGKPVQGSAAIVLQQIPANSIMDIEIVTAPSAKYDPDGNAGIINILTKQVAIDGTYLVANVLIGLPSVQPYQNKNATPRYGADVTFNRKKGKWDFSSGLDYRRYDISGRREGYVNTYLENVLTEFPSDGERSFDEINYSARASVSYDPNIRQSFTAGFFAGKRTKERTADILYLNQRRTRIPDSEFLGSEAYWDLYREKDEVFSGGNVLNEITYFNENLRVRRSDFAIASLDYSHRFSSSSTLKLSALYEHTVLGGPTDNANLDFPDTDRIFQLQYNDNRNPLDGVRLQMDYSKKRGDLTWDSGYQYRYLQHPGDFEYFDRDLQNNVWIENPLFTNGINLVRKIHSVYSQISGVKGKLEYTGGLRAEYFNRLVEIERPANSFKLNRFNLFPSVNLGYQWMDGLILKAGYSRRIERTTTFKMTPFPEREHSETLEQGDAELLPEYVDVAEIGAVKSWGDHSVFATAYYRYTQNVINRVNTVFNDTILNRIYTNVGASNAVGLELGTTLYPTKNWKIYFGGNVFNYRIQGTLFDEEINTANTVFSMNTNTNLTLTPTLKVQLAFNYLSERITAQGQDSEFYNPSFSVQKSFLEDRLSVNLQWQNIDLGLWSANEQRITTVRNNFYTTTNYVYEVDIIQLSITYRLNQLDRKDRMPESEFGKKEF